MVLLVPGWFPIPGTGVVKKIVTTRVGKSERALFTSTLAQTRWAVMYTLPTCGEQFIFFQETMVHLLDICSPFKVVSRHSTDKPWVTDGFRYLIRQTEATFTHGG